MSAKKTLTRAEAPHALPKYKKADVVAWQALERGEADVHQQQRVLKWVIEEAAGNYEFHFYKTDRETAFSLGRQFVGQQVVKMLRLNPMQVKDT